MSVLIDAKDAAIALVVLEDGSVMFASVEEIVVA